MKETTKKTALLGIFTALALGLSYLELLIPPLTLYAPGIKIGLPNIIIIFLLYKFDLKSAAAVSIIRIIIAALLFGSFSSFLYSLAGAILSLAVMALLKYSNLFSITVNSIIGAISHNLAQIILAAFVLGTEQLIYYFPLLSISAIISGFLVGICSILLIKIIKI